MRRLLLILCMTVSLICVSDNSDDVNAAYYKHRVVIETVQQKPVIAKTEDKSSNQKQIECLADNIYHESKGESYTGKIAVGFVSINRTKDQSFPDNVCEVVKQKKRGECQFSWYCDKKKKRESQKKLVAKLSDSEYSSINELAEHVYYNYEKISDPTKGALYFHANYVKVKRKGKIVKAKIDKHIFYTVKKKS